LWKKDGSNYCHPPSSLSGPTHGTKCVARKKLASSRLFGTMPWH